MFKTIVVPVGGAPQDERTVAVGARIARGCDAALRLVRVHVSLLRELEVPVGVENDLEHFEETYLGQLADGAHQAYGKAVDIEILRGPVAAAIAERASTLESPLVVMSTHGRTGFSRLWLGSVADGVIRHSATPVLLLRIPPHSVAASPPIEFRRVVVPLDGSPLAEAIVDPAVALSALDGGCIHLVRVVEEVILPDFPFAVVPPPTESPEALALRKQIAHEYLDGVAERVRSRPGIEDVSMEVCSDRSAAHAILEVVKARAADLVAVATHGRGASRLVLGSVADKLVRGSGCAVLVVRPTRMT